MLRGAGVRGVFDIKSAFNIVLKPVKLILPGPKEKRIDNRGGEGLGLESEVFKMGVVHWSSTSLSGLHSVHWTTHSVYHY